MLHWYSLFPNRRGSEEVLSMKIYEIDFNNKAIKYKITGWDIICVSDGNNLINEKDGERISTTFTNKALVGMDFEPMTDWSKVEVDTPIIVNNENCSHFAKYENGRVYYFSGGATSWSNEKIGLISVEVDDVRLAKIGEKDE